MSLHYLSYSFGLRHWFKFGVPVVSSPPSFDSSTEVSMVEGMLTLLVTLLSTRLHLGNVTKALFPSEGKGHDDDDEHTFE